MKKAMLLLLLLTCIVMGSTSPALADDSGDERTIPVTEWKCWICNKQFFTLTLDSINGKDKLQHKDPQYQQANWLRLKDRNPIPKCAKARDGAHFFEKIRDMMTSGYIMSERIDNYIS